MLRECEWLNYMSNIVIDFKLGNNDITISQTSLMLNLLGFDISIIFSEV